MASVDDILTFWFGRPDEPGYTEPRGRWFEQEPAFDAECARRFLATQEKAAEGGLQAWRDEPRSALALVLLLDQFPRNIFRDSARAYATDARALEVARHALARGLDVPLPPVWRWFFYMPFVHSEDIHDQRIAVSLFEALVPQYQTSATLRTYAQRHLDVIAHFGRFPHRNSLLGRDSTPEEMAFLQEPNSSFQ
ncbi:uncharacterized protein (DUF924 family) [Archangium gephyra]|uniref:Transmembrane protein n=1 Tax=Archangium gephyra TaxID=48 RepID=A0AAC8TBM1_9BACT|nr:DUF924 family protein [Archangium gephyra]AKI99969.1 Putative transmembrane protein [Archangium gephyra]REG33322.1 uncharacterized protein (DUF924 family) [Archangium gephyra]